MALRVGLGKGPGHLNREPQGLNSGTPWPYSFVVSKDYTGFGSSTMAGKDATTRSPLYVFANEDITGLTSVYYTSGEPASGPPAVVVNKGAGGTTSTTIEAAVSGATAREKAGYTYFQFGGNYEAVNNPIAGIIANAQLAAADLGHSNFIHIPKHIDNASASGGLDHHRLRDLVFQFKGLYPGRSQDAEYVFKKYSTGDVNDDAAQLVDQIPPSLAADNAHANLAGNRVLAHLAYEPWADAQDGGIPFIPYQRMRSTDATANQTNGGLVGVVEHDSSIAGTLTGVTVSVVNDSNFTVAIEAGAIKLRRASATYLSNGAYDVQVRATKAGKYRDSWVRVFMANSAPTGLYRAAINRMGLVRETPICGAVNLLDKISIAIGIKPLAGWDAEATLTARQFILFGANKVDIQVKQSVNLNMGVVFRNAAGASIFNLDTTNTAPNRINETNGIQFYFLNIDWTTGAYAQAVGANAAQTTGATGIVGGTGQQATLAFSASSTLNQLFMSGIGAGPSYAITRGCLCEVVLVAIWPDIIDMTSTTTNRDKIRDPATKRSILGATNGAVNGISPCLWFEGEAGNFEAGLDLANPTQQWTFTDRITATSVAA
jgi:hypothetical protein